MGGNAFDAAFASVHELWFEVAAAACIVLPPVLPAPPDRLHPTRAGTRRCWERCQITLQKRIRDFGALTFSPIKDASPGPSVPFMRSRSSKSRKAKRAPARTTSSLPFALWTSVAAMRPLPSPVLPTIQLGPRVRESYSPIVHRRLRDAANISASRLCAELAARIRRCDAALCPQVQHTGRDPTDEAEGSAM